MFEYNFNLIKVVDGDTVDIDIDLGFGVWLRNQRIRIMGIDTPESRTSDPVEKKYGILAKEQVEKYLVNCKKFKSFKDEKGKFGRILGDFEVYHSTSGRWMLMAEAMIQENYGVRYHGQSKDLIVSEHLNNRTKLKERGIIPE
jgi:micrococcal nuclease|tara:strand:+ start:10129 stop:10557 length:429 start_codon:yes stop_codon:yes gene_type:complete